MQQVVQRHPRVGVPIDFRGRFQLHQRTRREVGQQLAGMTRSEPPSVFPKRNHSCLRHAPIQSEDSQLCKTIALLRRQHAQAHFHRLPCVLVLLLGPMWIGQKLQVVLAKCLQHIGERDSALHHAAAERQRQRQSAALRNDLPGSGGQGLRIKPRR